MTDPRYSTPEGGAKAVEGLPDLTASALNRINSALRDGKRGSGEVGNG